MPKLLQNMQSQVPSIPYAGCLTQMYFFLFFGDMESFLLVAMAYDRYVAICFPLHYTTIMSPKLCLSMLALAWGVTTFQAMLHTLLMARLCFCADNVIPHFFCDLSALLKLSCSDTQVNDLVIFTIGGPLIVIPFSLIIMSYVLETDMTGRNQTAITEFLLQGLSMESEQKNLFYALFLVINLSFSDLCFSSVTMPKLLQNMQSQVPSIPYAGCLTQMYFFLFFGDLESFLLVAMAYDRYVAICFPLHYTTIMSPKLCFSLVALSWVLTTFHAMLHTLLMARLCFCADNVIPHFFCDLSALLKLSCSDTQVNDLVIFTIGGLVVVIPFLLIITSYVRIVLSILKVPSARGMRKAFSTCGSHLAVVSLFFGSIIALYLCPSADNSTVKEMAMAMMYTVVTPMLNPFIYSLRNRDIKGALGRVFYRKIFSRSL
ncbi:hypothetical protein QTO34_009454 [Cnephaeus nilssonii]|uniref:G-protein coupled receptors family 1 profile domain-containing protein n=1 Tax=Cnephaeus nilssonii TaxID=3371016 RepID=A0AA40HIK3_CNENI|nr:hypothetical protein QTO34_009454 [Eptesicus nilssonii]